MAMRVFGVTRRGESKRDGYLQLAGAMICSSARFLHELSACAAWMGGAGTRVYVLPALFHLTLFSLSSFFFKRKRQRLSFITRDAVMRVGLRSQPLFLSVCLLLGLATGTSE